MGVLSDLEPKSVFYFFEEITKIPHGSGNVDQISDYLVKFAKDRGLFCIQDEMKNVIIIKEASQGYESEPPLILQGHMDMVAVHEPDYEIDMKTEGLKVGIDGDKIYAEGTSLGGDDGIAVAYALAILDDENLKHPRLEVVITVDEEVGMDGARFIDLSVLKGHRLLNLDSEDEGIFLTSCAGGARVECRIPVKRAEFFSSGNRQEDGGKKENADQVICYEIEIGGLKGGHSGSEIDKERANSNCLFGRLLWKLSEKMEIGLVSVSGGLADNAIPRQTTAVAAVPKKNSALFADLVEEVNEQLLDELAVKDEGYYLHVRELEQKASRWADGESTKRIAAFLFAAPNGIQVMSVDIRGLVETSLNLGILKFTESDPELLAEFSVRSSVESAKNALIDKLKCVTGLAGGENEVTGDYPGWKYRVDSPLREKMITLYEEMYGQKPEVEAIHAGLECGLLGNKIDDLDCVSIGPDMRDIHTTEETLSISSVKRVWEFLVRLLERKG